VVTRRAFIGSLAGGLLAAPLAAEGQQVRKVARIGYLTGGSSSDAPHLREAFRDGLRELGWVEGDNIVIDYRFSEGRYDRLPELATDLVRLKVDLIVTVATPGAVAAKNATATIPIVGISLGDPVGFGLVPSLARPGGNVTGLSYSAGLELIGKQLELIREIVPKVRRVAVLSNPANPFHASAIRDVKGTSRSFGVQLELLEARVPTEFDGAFAAMVQEGAGALVVVPDQMFQLHRRRLADLAARSQIPAAYGIREYAEAGGLIAYGASLPDLWRRAATYVDKILKGAKPADLPIEQPTKFELVINLKTAKALGLTIPPSLLQRADQVIE
jgi:putative ABC transport system substrate-binding protein